MLFKVLAVALWVVAGGASVAQAQSVAQIGGPAEQPPSSFSGQQFVDSRGCVFLKAGYGGRVTWVPRVDSNRRPLCGLAPTFGAQLAVAKVAPVIVADPGLPMETVASLKPAAVAAAAPVVAQDSVSAPSGSVQTPPISGISTRKIGCYKSAPVPQRVQLRSGGTVVVCTRGDGTLTGWRPPLYPEGSGVGAAYSDADLPRVHVTSNGTVMKAAPAVPAARTNTIPTPPKGYVQAWDDDRLNPQRGIGTAAGQAAQDQIWTREIPAELVVDQPAARAPTTGRVMLSTKASPAEPVAPTAQGAAATYVQVGTFGVPANAAGAARRLEALGLPVSNGNLTKAGKTLQIVYAGPFSTAAQAQAALIAARNAGFGDAFLR